MSLIIGVDFDGTLVEHEFPKIGKEVPLAFGFLKEFQKVGARLILWTMRSDGPPHVGHAALSEAVDFCADRGILFWGINGNREQHTWTSSPKVYAQIYIDDAAFGCPLIREPNKRPYVDWAEVGPGVLRMIALHKNG